MNTREIYGKIFDITNNNMLENDMELEYSKEAFLFSTECPVGKCDVLDMIDLDNMSFMEATYAALFFRTADPGAYANWSKRKDMYTLDFRKRLINSIGGSQEYLEKGAVLKNNIYSNRAEANRPVSIGKTSDFSAANKAVNKLYRIYEKLPSPLKKLAKKLIGA